MLDDRLSKRALRGKLHAAGVDNGISFFVTGISSNGTKKVQVLPLLHGKFLHKTDTQRTVVINCPTSIKENRREQYLKEKTDVITANHQSSFLR